MSKTNSDGSHKADSRLVAQAEVKMWTFRYFVIDFGLLEDCGWARPAHRRVHHTSMCNFKLSRFVPMSRVLRILRRTRENFQGCPCASSATLKYPHSYAHNDLQ